VCIQEPFLTKLYLAILPYFVYVGLPVYLLTHPWELHLRAHNFRWRNPHRMACFEKLIIISLTLLNAKHI